LQAVKTEFKLFGDVLNTAQKKILNAHDDIDKLVGTRTKQIQRKLKDFEDLPSAEASTLLGDVEESITE
jgi:DNA recombination protein RmuC